ncbi:DNA polymerase [BeAn 58058 virus]|uniref:DNA polymerase n=1 Tax=BeAn 58058 virus TaxID=67082 RepID=UPI00090A42C9|nr:DNA polymerase [BeAn 58058 virus]APG58249.1 DNA polymerase [BeAn 58058 virus]
MEIKCINWFESKGDTRLIFLKARTKDSKTIFIRFSYYFYYVVTDDVYKKLIPKPYESESLGSMNIIDVSEKVNTVVTNVTKDEKIVNTWLIKEIKKRNVDSVMSDFLNNNWFFITNNISPEGYYKIDIDSLEKINNQCYHCYDPKSLFREPINGFDVSISYLFLDIECHFDKKFPSVFLNPVSHISCCYIDLFKNEFRFTLLNKDMLSEDDIEKTKSIDCLYVSSIQELNYNKKYIICTELVMLQIIKKIIEQSFDYIVTFNGNNFDFRYISNRLELLTGDKIIFKSPDKNEIVHLCIYERNISSHKGVGGVFNTTYHINNNNGTIFFDLYSYIQKSEKLESYKLDNISKNVFNCKVLIKSVKNGLCTLIGNSTTDNIGKVETFLNVLMTGNYINVGDDIFKIVHKDISSSSFVVVVENKDNIFTENELCIISFGKDDVNLSDMYKSYNLDIAIEMGEYCMHDACLCKYLWKYYGIDTKIDAAACTYMLPQSMVFEYRASTLIKGPLLKLLLDKKIILSRSEKLAKYPYEGGKVFVPRQKMFINNVIVYDYNSLYPNVCIYGNLSPETLISVFVANNRLEMEINKKEIEKLYPGPDFISVHCDPRSSDLISEIAVFDRRTEGIIPTLLKIFLSERLKYKKLLKNTDNVSKKAIYDSMQYTYKILSNSVYGLMGFRNSVLYSYSSAKSCTSIGRQMIHYLNSVLHGCKIFSGKFNLASYPINPFFKNYIHNDVIISSNLPEEYDIEFKVVYGDTDSAFVEVNINDIDKSIEIAKELEHVINKYVLFDTFKIEFEAVYKNLIMQSKKKYTTLKYLPSSNSTSIPDRINKGTSETRRDVSKFHKYMIKIYKNRLLEILSDGKLSSVKICLEILSSLENDLLIEFERRTAKLEMFLLSRTHHCNYKAADNPNLALVSEYNKNSNEIIEIGERYYFIYICDASLPWQRKLVNIKTYECIVDRTFSLGTNKRIFYEVYFKRLCTEVVNLLDNKVLCTSFFEKMFGTRPIYYS